MVAFDFPRPRRPANPHRLSSTSDGDIPVIDQPVRMVSVDTPEKPGYAGLPPAAQATLDRCRPPEGRHLQRPPPGLREYLLGRLTTDAAERHIDAGLQATAEFERLQFPAVESTPSSAGRRRSRRRVGHPIPPARAESYTVTLEPAA
jgi:hypothetical protein